MLIQAHLNAVLLTRPRTLSALIQDPMHPPLSLNDHPRAHAHAQAKAAEIEAAKAALAEAEAAVAELKASFQDDPLSLVPWMQVRRGHLCD